MNKVLSSFVALLAAFVATPCMAFAPMHNSGVMMASVQPTLNNHILGASPFDAMDFVTHSGAGAIDVNALANVASSSVLLSETEAWVQPLSLVLGPFLNFFSFAMVSR